MRPATDGGYPKKISTAAKLLYMTTKDLKEHNEALTYYELHVQMRDSINNEETQKATIRQQTKYEFEKEQLIKEQQEKETARLEKEKTERNRKTERYTEEKETERKKK